MEDLLTVVMKLPNILGYVNVFTIAFDDIM